MARRFDRTTNDSLGVAVALVASAPFTMACWARPTNDVIQYLTWGMTSGTGHYHFLDFEGSAAPHNVRVVSAAGGSQAIAQTSTTYSGGVWQHICGVWASTTSRSAYLNGGGKGTNTDSRNPTGLSSTFLSPNNSSAMDGYIAEAAVWDVALTDAEVAVLAAGYSPLFVRPESLVAYLPLIRDDDEDLVGGLSFTPAGSPSVTSHPKIIYPGASAYAFTAASGGSSSIAPVSMHSYRRRRV